MNGRRQVFIHAPETDGMSYPPDCPFKTQRAILTRQRLLSLGLLGGPDEPELEPRQASPEELEWFHTPQYLDELQRASRGDLTVTGLHMGLGGEDTPVFPHMFEYPRLACGASLTAAELLLAGEAHVAFNLLGGFHHAMADRAAGFCYLNDVVIACERLARAGKRVAYLDVDAHHGDGVQQAFYRRRDVLTISMHESGKTLFPWGGFEHEIGEGPGLGWNVNVPLPPGTFDEAFLGAFRRVVLPILCAVRPEVLVLELGLDTLAGDPLTHLNLTNNVHVEIIRDLLPMGMPTLVVGGGGYHVDNTVRGWALAWQTFAGEAQEHDLSLGFGGVMLGSSEWAGGLRDHELPVRPDQRHAVESELGPTLDRVSGLLFPLHGLSAPEVSAVGGTLDMRSSTPPANPQRPGTDLD